MSAGIAWTRAECEQLTALWASGMPALQIARELDISKNAVVGKVHRLGLELRPSPIRSRDAGKWAKAKAMALDGKSSTTISIECGISRETVRDMMHDLGLTARAPVRLRAPPLPPLPSLADAGVADLALPERPAAFVAAPPLEDERCCWVMQARPVRYCDAPVHARRAPYCASHRAASRGRAVRDHQEAAE